MDSSLVFVAILVLAVAVFGAAAAWVVMAVLRSTWRGASRSRG